MITFLDKNEKPYYELLVKGHSDLTDNQIYQLYQKHYMCRHDCKGCNLFQYEVIGTENKRILKPFLCDKPGRLLAIKNIVPKRYYGKHLETYEDIPEKNRNEIYKWEHEFTKDNTTSLFVSGGPGSGKTAITYYLLSKLMKNNYIRNTFCMISEDLFQEIRFVELEGINIIEMYKHTQLFIIQDLGRGKQSQHKSDRFFILLDHLYNNEIPIIVTSEYNEIELQDKIGEAEMSRILHRVGNNKIYLKNSNYRLK